MLTFLRLSIKYKSKKIIIEEWRIGKRGKLFKIYKFHEIERSEFHSIPQPKKQVNQNKLCKIKVDSLIYQFICWMHQHRFDKIPQLFNVIQGDMSIVGKTPQDLYMAIQISKQAKNHFTYAPRIISYKQLHKIKIRSETSIFTDKLRVENSKYLSHWPLKNDLKLLLISICKASIMVHKKTNYY